MTLSLTDYIHVKTHDYNKHPDFWNESLPRVITKFVVTILAKMATRNEPFLGFITTHALHQVSQLKIESGWAAMLTLPECRPQLGQRNSRIVPLHCSLPVSFVVAHSFITPCSDYLLYIVSVDSINYFDFYSL